MRSKRPQSGSLSKLRSQDAKLSSPKEPVHLQPPRLQRRRLDLESVMLFHRPLQSQRLPLQRLAQDYLHPRSPLQPMLPRWARCGRRKLGPRKAACSVWGSGMPRLKKRSSANASKPLLRLRQNMTFRELGQPQLLLWARHFQHVHHFQ